MKNFFENLKYKLLALVLIAIGYWSTTIEGDGTVFVFLLLIAVPMLFVDVAELDNFDK